MIEKHWQTKYIVMNPGIADATPGDDLYDGTTGVLNLAIDSVGVYGPVAGSGNHVEVSAAPGTAIKIIKRRNTAGDKSPLYTRLFEDSDWINAFCRKGIEINLLEARTGANNSHLVGAPDAALTGKIEVTDNLNYQIQVSGHGDRTDWYNGSYNTPTTFGFYQAPDFTANLVAEIDARDLIVQEVALDFNSKARQMSFVMCLEDPATLVAAGANVIPVVDLSDGTVAIGTTVVLGYDKQGRVHSFVLNKTIQQSFIALEAATPGLVLKPYLVPGTTGLSAAAITAAGGVAGTTLSACTNLYFVALDEATAQYDYRMQTKRRLEVGLVAGFNSTTLTEVSKTDEGQGQFHQLEIAYRMHNRYEQTHRSRFPHQSYYLEFDNGGLLADATYDYFVIEHCDDRTATSGMPSNNNFRTIIAIVSFEDDSTPYFTGAANPQKTYILGALDAFIAANGLGSPITPVPNLP